jgi:hypothetical protein
MRPDALTPEDQAVIPACLHAASNGPFFPDWEFQTLFGLDRQTVADIAARWPDVDPADEEVQAAVLGVLGHLLGYPHGHGLEEAVGYSAERIRVALNAMAER